MNTDTRKNLPGPGSPVIALAVGLLLAGLCGFLTARSGSAFLGFGLLFSCVLPLVVCLLTRRFLALVAPLVNMALVHFFLYFLPGSEPSYLGSESGKNLFLFFSGGSVSIGFVIAGLYMRAPRTKPPPP